jgi:hypothetical protein
MGPNIYIFLTNMHIIHFSETFFQKFFMVLSAVQFVHVSTWLFLQNDPKLCILYWSLFCVSVGMSHTHMQ